MDTGGVYQPRIGSAGNRCFVADPKLASDRLMTAINVVASDPRAVAQVTLFALDSDAAEAEAAALDAADATLGYSCYGTTRVRDSRLIDSWTWPDPVLRMPAGTGVRLEAGRKLVVQIHYDIALTGSAFQTATRVDLALDGHGREAREARVVPVVAERHAAAGATLRRGRGHPHHRASPARGRHRGAHAHPRRDLAPRGRAWRGTTICLGSFDHWHVIEQQLDRAQTPALLEAYDRVRVSCAYETLGRDRPVKFGDGIDDEECVAYLFVTDAD